MEQYWFYIAGITFFTLMQILFVTVTKEFALKNKWTYTFPVIIAVFGLTLIPNPLIYDIYILGGIMMSINLGLADMKYREIHGLSYLFFLPPIVVGIVTARPVWTAFLGVALFFFLLWLADKFERFGSLGGADIKMLLIFSLCYPFNMVFSFAIVSLFLTVILGLVLMLVERNVHPSTPMLATLSVGHAFCAVFMMILDRSWLI